MVGGIGSTKRGEDRGLVINDYSHHIHGSVYNTTNTFHAPVTTIHHANTVNLSILGNGDLELLNTLPMHPDTSSQWADYLKDSRRGDLKRIRIWGDDLYIKESMLWVHGPAGTGKSTLARQLVYELRSQNRLAASLFFSVLSTDTLGPDTALRLIGGEIGRTHRNAIPAIAEAVRHCHGASLPVLIEMFIRKPLESLHLPHPLTIVMDAADEWRFHYHFITELGYLSSLSSLVRFVVLSRSEPKLERFDGIPIRPYHLEPVSIEVMQGYLHARFEKIDWPNGRRPGSKDILSLATMASGLFIWIENVCSLLERPQGNPHDTLTAILLHRQPVETHVLAKLYFNAIGLLFPQPGDREAIRELLGFMLVLQEPLPLDAFASLSGIDARSANSMMSGLKALQIRRLDASCAMVYPISTPFHASFGEYLQSTSIPPEFSFLISLPTFHMQFGLACLRAIAQIAPTAGDLNLSPESAYGVKLWPYHIVAGCPSVEPQMSQLQKPKEAQQRPAFWRMAQSTKALFRKRPSGRQSQPTTRTAMMDLLEGVTSLRKLSLWAPLFLKLLCPDYNSDPLSRKDIPSLMQAVAHFLEGTGVSTVTVFQIPCLEIAVRIAFYDPRHWTSLHRAYHLLGETTDSPDPLHQSVRASENAFKAAQAFEPEDCARYMRFFARSLRIRATRLGNEDDMEKAISLQRDALKLCPSRHPDRTSALVDLASSLSSRFKLSASTGDLEEAIALHREVLRLRPSGHPDRISSLYNLSSTLHSLFQTTGSVRDLEEAITYTRETLLLQPKGHPDRRRSLWNLQTTLYDLFEIRGIIGDLQEAISLAEEALVLYTPDSSQHGILQRRLPFYKERLAKETAM